VRVFKGAVIGCGFFSRHHVEAWRRMPNVQIVAACDNHLERARTVSERAYVSAEAMLEREDLDFVDIVSRSEAHLGLVMKAAQRGLAITCQKPMAPDWATACRMVEVAEANGVRLMIHDNWRWQPWYRAARKMIADGHIGRPVSYGFRCRWKDGAGEAPYGTQSYFRDLRRFIIDETLVHHIDTARLLFGDIQTVYAEAMRVNPRIQGEDHAILTVCHTAPVMGCLHGHSFAALEDAGPSIDESVFEGEAGSIRISGAGEIWSGHKRIWTQDFWKGYRGDSVYNTLAHFIQCLETGQRFETEAREYLEKTFAAVEAAYASVESKRQVAIAEIVGCRSGASE
jgi:D-apiose dehydrogenase